MEKTPMYAVVSSSRPQKSRRVLWTAFIVSVTGLLVAAVTGYVEKRQIDRLDALEETVRQMQLHMEQLLQFSHDYFEYEDELEDHQGGLYEELTVRGVVRRKRQAPREGDRKDGVPIYDQAYGIDLNTRFNSEGLRLYESFVDHQGTGDPRPDQVSFESTESPIKPHHRLHVSQEKDDAATRDDGGGDDDDDDDTADDSYALRRRQARRPSSVLQRRSRVKATAPNDGVSATTLNSVVPQTPAAPTVVEQRPQHVKQGIADALAGPYVRKGSKKKKLRKKHTRRGGRRRSRSAITLGHFVAAPANRTGHHSEGEVHDEWTPAAWMDKLGLNRKYALRRGAVTVKESGLYYLYAQVLYEQGRFGTGFQLMVDGIPVMECTMTPAQPSHSCHTSGTTYLQRNAAVYIRDNESHMKAIRREENSFFGLIKLMDAPESAEKLILG